MSINQKVFNLSARDYNAACSHCKLVDQRFYSIAVDRNPPALSGSLRKAERRKEGRRAKRMRKSQLSEKLREERHSKQRHGAYSRKKEYLVATYLHTCYRWITTVNTTLFQAEYCNAEVRGAVRYILICGQYVQVSCVCRRRPGLTVFQCRLSRNHREAARGTKTLNSKQTSMHVYINISFGARQSR